jgi:hypothetical protein
MVAFSALADKPIPGVGKYKTSTGLVRDTALVLQCDQGLVSNRVP